MKIVLRVGRLTIILSLLNLLLFGASAQQSDKGKWIFDATPDKMTDEATPTVFLNSNNVAGAILTIHKFKENGQSFITLFLPSNLALMMNKKYLSNEDRRLYQVYYKEAVEVSWRIDDAPMKGELWDCHRDGVDALNNTEILRAMLKGKILLLRLSGVSTVLEFDVRGLDYYMPKLGLSN